MKNQTQLTAQLIKEATLTATIAQSFLSNKIQSKKDLVTVARVVMTDLEISFKQALEFINKVTEIANKVLDDQLAKSKI